MTPMIHSGDLEFITNYSDDISTPPEGADSGTASRVMTHSGSPSLHAIIDELPSEDNPVMSEEESSGSPLLRSCHAMMPATPS
jgi:hypothetical protein